MDTPSENPNQFRFDLDAAISSQLIPKLEAVRSQAFRQDVGPDESGIYALYWRGQLVYVGKATKELTKSKRSLKDRLNEHFGKLSKISDITLSDIACRFLTFESEWWVFAAEFALIVHYKPEWNGTGFGSKTPGKGRPGTGREDKFMKWIKTASQTSSDDTDTNRDVNPSPGG